MNKISLFVVLVIIIISGSIFLHGSKTQEEESVTQPETVTQTPVSTYAPTPVLIAPTSTGLIKQKKINSVCEPVYIRCASNYHVESFTDSRGCPSYRCALGAPVR